MCYNIILTIILGGVSDLQNTDIKSGGKYQLRFAAGLYWLIDMKQSDASYISPVPLNEVGARIWRMFESGASREEICSWLCNEFGIGPEQAQKDFGDFAEQLRSQNIDFGGTQ